MATPAALISADAAMAVLGMLMPGYEYTTRSLSVKRCQLRKNVAEAGYLTVQRRGRICLYEQREAERLRKRIDNGELIMDLSGHITRLNNSKAA